VVYTPAAQLDPGLVAAKAVAELKNRSRQLFVVRTSAIVLLVMLLSLFYLNRRLRRAEQLKAQSEQRFKLAVEGTNDGIWDCDLVGQVAYYSKRCRTILAINEREAGVPVITLLYEYALPIDRAHVNHALQRYLSDKQ
jgi:PAS domain-containing protein